MLDNGLVVEESFLDRTMKYDSWHKGSELEVQNEVQSMG